MSEPEVQTIDDVNPITDMIQHALDQDFNKANDLFNSMMTVKMSDLLDQEKINLAGQIYDGEEPEDEEQLELDLEDEEGSEEETSEAEEEAEEEETSEEPDPDIEGHPV